MTTSPSKCLDCDLVGLKRLGLYENKYGNLVCDFHLSNPVSIKEIRASSYELDDEMKATDEQMYESGTEAYVCDECAEALI